MSFVIDVSGVSKKYILTHQNSASYKTLRETFPTLWREIKAHLAGDIKYNRNDKEEFLALNNIQFQIRAGERVGIIGRNGAGKSTLLKIISRIVAPTTGQIKLRGKVASLLEVGTGFNPELTGRENIFLNGAILGMSREEIRKKFDAIVEFAGVEKFLDTPVKRYSSGMHVRLAFSVAAHIDPDILIVDEVLAVGDMQFQRKCMERMKELENEGRTILFVTHNMDAMLALCNRAIVLEKGAICFDGPVLEGQKKYLQLQASKGRSLQDNAGRGGSGGVEVYSVEQLSAQEQPKETFTIGEPMIIKVGVRATVPSFADKPLDIAIGIDTEDSVRLFTVRSSWLNSTYQFTDNLLTATCKINGLWLVPGCYLINIAIIYQNESLDVVQHCGTFQVIEKERGLYINRAADHGYLSLPCDFF